MNEETTYVFKIRRKSDGKFWTPGSSQRWTGYGKGYMKLGVARNAFSNHRMRISECEIVRASISTNWEVVPW